MNKNHNCLHVVNNVNAKEIWHKDNGIANSIGKNQYIVQCADLHVHCFPDLITQSKDTEWYTKGGSVPILPQE